MARKRTKRDEELSTRAKIRKKLIDIFKDVEAGFIDQAERSDDQMDCWDAYNCKLGEKQIYQGSSQLFVPIVHDAVNARKTRFVNQVFPKTGRYVDIVSEDGDIPHAEIALLEHYIRKAKLRTKVAPPLNRNGDIEGQYNVYVSWSTRERHVAWKEPKPLRVAGIEAPGVDDVDEMQEDIVADDHPAVEVLSDADVLILPATADGVDDALDNGGSVSVIRRWSKAEIRRMIDDEEIVEDAGEALLKAMDKAEKFRGRDVVKKHADAAGVKGAGKYTLGYETWTKLKVDGVYRLCVARYGGEDQVLGAKLNPYWCDECPVISVPVEKTAGIAKGISLVKPCVDMQAAANDALNEGMDSATYGLCPIVMTDPLKNPRTGTMIVDMGAIWETDPNSTKFAQFPELWKGAFEIVASAKTQIFQTLSVNPAMMPQQTGQKGGKRNQAEIANEQQVDMLTTANAVGVQEEGVWTPIVQRFAAYVALFRNEKITVRAFGRMGIQANMAKIPPLQLGRKIEFLWYGVEQARNAAAMQQQIGAMNVLNGLNPARTPGRTLNLTPIVDMLVENVFGPRIGPLVFEDVSKTLTLDPEMENEMLRDGHQLPVSPLDDDPAHMQSHMEAEKASGDPHGTFRAHRFKHQMSMAMKAQQQAQQAGQQGAPGGSGPGAAGTPRQGAQPGQSRPAQQPAGAIHADQMARAGAPGMPRKM